MATKKMKPYVEPASYFPDEILKEFGLGKYAESNAKELPKDDKKK